MVQKIISTNYSQPKQLQIDYRLAGATFLLHKFNGYSLAISFGCASSFGFERYEQHEEYRAHHEHEEHQSI